MATLKIRIVLNPGGVGVRLHKLARVADEFEKLFRYLADDMGVPSGVDDWLARDFKNSSVSYDVELSKPVNPEIVSRYNGHIERLLDFREDAPLINGEVKTRTLRQYVEVGRILDNDEQIIVGLYKNGAAPEEKKLQKIAPLEMERVLTVPITYMGSVQGKTGTWYKGSDYFNLRDVLTGDTVKCWYPKSLYQEINKAYGDADSVVHVSGLISSNRIEKRPLEITVSGIKTYSPLSDQEFRKFYGIAPNMTGDESTEEYISRIRDDGEA